MQIDNKLQAYAEILHSSRSLKTNTQKHLLHIQCKCNIETQYTYQVEPQHFSGIYSVTFLVNAKHQNFAVIF